MQFDLTLKNDEDMVYLPSTLCLDIASIFEKHSAEEKESSVIISQSNTHGQADQELKNFHLLFEEPYEN